MTPHPESHVLKDIAFLREAAGFFEHADAMGEDRAFWANTYNAEACRRIADRLAALLASQEAAAPSEEPVARLKRRIDYRLNETLCGMKPEHDDSIHGFNEAWRIADEVFAALASPAPVAPVAHHSDDAAVDRFAAAMKAKLAKKREEGRGGWDGPDCSALILSDLLRAHVDKGDPLDAGNLAMMLHQRGERII